MKIQLAYILISLCGIATSCSDDLGNYNYQDINKVNVDISDAPTSIFLGDTLRITPELNNSLSSAEGDYTYRWKLSTGEVLSTQQNLSYKIHQAPGTYQLALYVTDKKSGVTWQQRKSLLVRTPTYEGYLILHEINETARLDMLSYQENNFIHYADVLSHVGSTLELKGHPISVASLKNRPQNSSDFNYNIFILTDQLATRIDPETFGWSEQLDLRHRFLGGVPTNFQPEKLYVSEFQNWPYFKILDDGKLIATNGNSPFVYSLYTNYYRNTMATIPIHTKIATMGTITTVYNTAEKTFMNAASGIFQSINKELYPNYPEGLELIDLFNNHYTYGFDENWRQKSAAYAILKNPQTAQISLLRFYIGLNADYHETINGPDIGHATHFAASPELDYLFYSVGGKIYQFDMALKRTQLMLDLGDEHVTVLTFVPFYQNMNNFQNANYAQWGKWLTVATESPTTANGKHGTLRLYEVPPVNQPLIKKQEWKGFGKIVSIAYRERN